MRIVFTSDFVDLENIGGAGRVLWELAGGLLRRGHRLTFVVGGPEARSGNVDHPAGRIRWISFPYPREGRRGPRFVFDVRRRVRAAYRLAGPADVVVHNQPLTADALSASCTPSVYLFHSPWPAEFVAERFGDDQLPQRMSRGWITHLQTSLRARVEGRAVRRARTVVTLSEHMRQRACSMYGVDPRRVLVCPGGVDLDRFSPKGEVERRSLRARRSVDAETLVFACVRRLVPRTGVDLLVDALSMADTQLPPWRAWIAGRGPQESSLDAMIRGSSVGSRIERLGYVSDSELTDLYCAADATLVPTRALEGFGLSTLESMACGTPVIATPIGGSVELLEQCPMCRLAPTATAEGLAAAMIDWAGTIARSAGARGTTRRFVE
ncbi:MAG: glycosyltransferase family 4 protein, partial [Planctomycetes bacterium]|nr:glycosyltransferase family 4 protein [Planctomycetota bacterium]